MGENRSHLNIILILAFLTCFRSFAFAEDKPQYSKYDSLVRNLEQTFEPSYITLGGGYNRSGSFHGNDLWYEAQMYVHYNWLDNCKEKNRCDRDNVFRLYAPIRLQVRQFRTDSSPVVTPSYNPGARLYYWHTSWVSPDSYFQFVSLGLHHYSNGQSGPPRNPDGQINTKDGSFSTDYVEGAYYYEKLDKESDVDYSAKFNVRKYLTGWTWEPAQTDYYETWLTQASGKKKLTHYGITAQLTVGYKYGRKYVAPGNNASFKDNMQYTAELSVPVKCPRVRLFYWNDMRAYLRWDKGYDYYNINYQNKMNRIQFGIVASTF